MLVGRISDPSGIVDYGIAESRNRGIAVLRYCN